MRGGVRAIGRNSPLIPSCRAARRRFRRQSRQCARSEQASPSHISVEATDGARSDLYDAGHALDDAATADRVGWLVERLGLAPIPDEILTEVGLPDR